MANARRLALLDEAAQLRRMAKLARLDGREDLAERFEAMADDDEEAAERP
jgi:hypothetical protein